MKTHDIICPVSGEKLGTVTLPDDATEDRVLQATRAYRKAGVQSAEEITNTEAKRVRERRRKQILATLETPLGDSATVRQVVARVNLLSELLARVL